MDQSQSFQFTPKQIFLFGIMEGILVLCTIGFFILLKIVLSGGDFALGANAIGDGNNRVAADNGAAAPAANISVPPVDLKNDHILGNKNAKVTLIEYSDFQCPYCGRFYQTVKQALQNFDGQIRFVYRHFPLSGHAQAQPAAEASECAADQGKFWEFHDKLFENQSNLSPDYYQQVARELGLNERAFNDCVTSEKHRSKVQSQAAGASTTGLEGTPHTIVVGPNGELTTVGGAQPYSSLEAAIKKYVN